MRKMFLFCILLAYSSLFSQFKYSDTKNVKIDQIKNKVSVKTFNLLEGTSESQNDFSFLGLGAVGYSKTVGPYYEGFDPSIALKLSLFYFIDVPWFVGFDYNYSSFTGDQIPRHYKGYDMDRKCKELSFNEYWVEVGGIFDLFSEKLYLYGLLGLGWISQTQDLEFVYIDYFHGVQKNIPLIDKQDTAGYKLEAGFIIPIFEKINTIVSFSFQTHEVQRYSSGLIAVYSDGTSSGVNDENNGLLKLSIGIMYPLW